MLKTMVAPGRRYMYIDYCFFHSTYHFEKEVDPNISRQLKFRDIKILVTSHSYVILWLHDYSY